MAWVECAPAVYPSASAMARGCYNAAAMAWDERMKDFHARRAKARGMGGPERLARRRATGSLNAREQVERRLDPGSPTPW
jgi:acetyl-CoA carboxylase carboxyltransferase component